MVSLLIWSINFVGFWFLCVSVPRHRKGFRLVQLNDVSELLYRFTGFLLLLLSPLYIILFSVNVIDELINWFGVLTFTALGIALLLTYRRERLRNLT